MKSYCFGNPFSTGTVIEKPSKFISQFKEKGFSILQEKGRTIFRRKLYYDDIILGLGEQLGGINRRGRKYVMYNTDTHEHTPDQLSLYGSHPFMIIAGRNKQGIFVDFPGEINFDVGFEDNDKLEITVHSEDFNLYFWEENFWQDIVRSYLELTGGVYVPPKWAFGYQQSRWSYKDADTVCMIADKFRQLGIPCDAIYLDIDYMQDYKVFTVDEERFGDFKKFNQELKSQGFHLVPIIDPGVKIEEDYKIYEEGKKEGYFCKKENGDSFAAAVWPGMTHLPDFSRSSVRDWWGKLYEEFIEAGVEGFWNDMNEPAIFYTDYQQKEIEELLKDQKKGDKDLVHLHHRINEFHNNRRDYKRIYQQNDAGKIINHDKIHNLYGANMVHAFSEYVQKEYPEKRFLIFSRSSYSGMQSYAGIWYGDNKSWWKHLLLNIKMMVNCNLVGFFYSGADIGGFGSDCNSELMIRWLQLGVFSPLFRNHSAIHTRKQELWEFDKKTLIQARSTIRLRYALIPWLYSQFLEFASMNVPLIRPLMWDFGDNRSVGVEDQFLYGESLMVAPVYNANARGRNVYLPDDKWLLWTARSWEERNMQVISSGDHYLEAELDKQLILIRENRLIALQEPEEFIDQRKPDTLILTGLVTGKAAAKILIDQGKYPPFAGMSVLEISIEKKLDNYLVNTKIINRRKIQWKHIIFEIYNGIGELVVIHKNI